jgi:hypothetical protein
MDASNGESSPALAGAFSATSPHSSAENSPRPEVSAMDASVELNGLKASAESRSSQQFCLRWNNHQVSFGRRSIHAIVAATSIA